MEFLVGPIEILADLEQLHKRDLFEGLSTVLIVASMFHELGDGVFGLKGDSEVDEEVQVAESVHVQLRNHEVHLVEEGLGSFELFLRRVLQKLLLNVLGQVLQH